MIDRRQFSKLGLATFALGMTPGWLNAQVAAAGRRDTLTIAVTGIANSGALTSLAENNNVGKAVLYSIFDPLIELDRSGSMDLRPGLATSWERIDPMTVDITLRQGVKFHNGEELTAEDVVFTFAAQGMVGDGSDSMVPEVVMAQGRSLIPGLAKVEALGAYTVRFQCDSTNLALEKQLSRFGTEPFSKKAFLEAADYEAWALKPVGTGPFMPTEFDRDSRLVLSVFDDYWGGKANVDRIALTLVPETSSRVNGLLAGEYDLITELPPDQLDTIVQTGDLEIVGGAIEGQFFLQFVKHDVPLADPRIRRAMTHSVDRQLIVDALWGGRTVVPRGRQFDSYSDMFIEDWQNPEYDLDKARALLDEAGYDGEIIPFRVMNNYYPLQVATAQVLVDMWSQVGLNVQIQMCENWAQVRDTTTPRGLFFWSNNAQFGDPVGSFPIQQGPGGIVQRNGEWSNEEFNALNDVLVKGDNQADRKAAFRRMLEIAEVEDPSYLTLSQAALFYGKRQDFTWHATRDRELDFRASNLTF